MTWITLALLPSLAFAFQPDGDVYIGQEPTRIRRYHKETQHQLRQAEAWLAFVEGEGEGWQVRFDERTGTPRRMWGAGIDLGLSSDADGDDVAAAVRELLSRHEGLLGVSVDRLSLGQARYVAHRDAWIVRLDQVVPLPDDDQGGIIGGDLGVIPGAEGMPQPDLAADSSWHTLDELAQHGDPMVWRGGVKVSIQMGRVVMMGMDTYPDADSVDMVPTLSAQTAIELAIADGPEPDATHEIEGATLMVLPLEVDGDLEYHLAWVTRTRTAWESSPGIWLSFVDAHSGELLNVHNQVRYATGTVYGYHDTRTVNGDFSTSPMSYISVSSDTDSGYTDVDGIYVLDGDGREIDAVAGQYFYVRNYSGSAGYMAWAEGDATWTDDEASQAEIDSYRFLSDVREWLELHGDDISWVSERITSNVNINSSCNAYFDGNVNFYKEGSGCNNTGRIADVNYHEWGHGLHYYAAWSSYVDGSLSEGAADSTAFLQTDDSTIAPYFMTSGSGIRDVSDDRVYPDDVTGESHYDGLIFGGAVWDTWAALEEDLGDRDEAQYVLSTLLVDTLRANPEIETSYDDMVAADDDNGDLSDGTPHMCAIIEGFAPHGLGPGGGSGSVLMASHTPLDNQGDDLAEYSLDVELANTAEACVEGEWAGGTVFYSTDAGETWESAELDLTDDGLSGSIPEVAAGSIVHYYVVADAGADGEVYAPTGGSINPHSFYVGNLETIRCDAFDDGEADYSHELLGGSSSEGADDWQHGRPMGYADDPDDAYSGRYVWGNDLGGGNYNGEYQNEKQNRLTSAPFDVTGHDKVIVQFRRWLNIEDGYYDQARVLANDEVVWENHATSRSLGDEHHQDDQWALHTIEVDLEGADELVLGWEIETDQGLSFGGWNIDDVCVYAIGEPTVPDDDTGLDTGALGDDETDPPGGGRVKGGELTGCGCSTSAAPGRAFAALLLAGLALVRRRREGE